MGCDGHPEQARRSGSMMTARHHAARGDRERGEPADAAGRLLAPASAAILHASSPRRRRRACRGEAVAATQGYAWPVTSDSPDIPHAA
jgi:hypothetical protein